MTLVPNLRLLSSGNSIPLFLLFWISFTLCSCKGLQPAQGQTPGAPSGKKTEREKLDDIQGTRVYDPITRSWLFVPAASAEKVDTFVFKNVQPYYGTAITYFPNPFAPDVKALEKLLTEKRPPVTVASDMPRIEKKEQYKIMVALPFTANDAEQSQESAQGRVGRWAVNFYGGIRLAAREIEKEGIRLNVFVRDSKSDDSGIPALLSNTDMQGTDVFIGPYRREQIRAVADQAKKEDFVMVSPYSAVAGLVQANPNFVQVNPSLEQHCRAILRHARAEFSEDDLLILYRANQASEKACTEFFQNANAGLTGGQEQGLIPELTIESSNFAGTNIGLLIKNRPQLGILIPSWADQNFIVMLLRRIIEAKEENQRIVVYGMPQWLEFQNFEFDYFEKLNVRISSSSFVSTAEEDVKAFRLEYFNEYGTIPDLSAYEGYGLFRYISRMLKEYGRYFQYYLDVNPSTEMHTRYEFQSMLEPVPSGQADLLKFIGRFENTFVNILEFREFHFQRMD